MNKVLVWFEDNAVPFSAVELAASGLCGRIVLTTWKPAFDETNVLRADSSWGTKALVAVSLLDTMVKNFG